MNKDNIITLADKSDNNAMITPLQLVKDVAKQIENGEIQGTSAIVILLDAPDFDYNWRYFLSNLRVSQMVSLLECVKSHGIDILNGKHE